MCNCKWTEIILGAIILVFTFWETAVSMWLVVIAAVLIILHSLTCRNLAACVDPAEAAQTMKTRTRKQK